MRFGELTASTISLGYLKKRFLGYSFEPQGGGAAVVLRGRDVGAPLRAAAKADSRGHRVWAALDAEGGIVGVFGDMRELPDEALFSGSAKIADLARRPPKKADDGWYLSLFKEVLVEDRIDPAVKLAAIAAPGGAERLARCLALVPSTLHSEIIKVLDLEARWKDVERDLDDCLVRISEAVLDVVELDSLRETRSLRVFDRAEKARREEEKLKVLEEERRRAEEEDRRKQREEELRRAAEDREKKRLQEERAAAFRGALENRRIAADVSGIEVNEAFLEVFERVEKGEKFLFVTGKPGTGKSTLIRALRNRLSSTSVTVLSFTGMAALAVGGQTIHSFFQFPFGVLADGYVSDRWSFKKKARAMEVLVIDEVSMVRADLLDAMDSSLRAARGDTRPFGGVRVVLVGDLYQLPPVIDRDAAVLEHYRRRFGEKRFFDAARVVAGTPPRLIELETVYRQKDRDFLDFLHKIRDCSISGEELDAFNARIMDLPAFGNADFCISVSPHNATTAAKNAEMLERLPGKAFHFAAVLKGKAEKADGSEKKFPADTDLALKLGAQVMFVKNDPGRRWMNGDIGMVDEFRDGTIRVRSQQGIVDVLPESWPIIEYDLDPVTNKLASREVGSFVQYPLKLAWAATIHKMQGQTVDRITIDLGAGAFETGMTYVALSRCRTIEGIRLSRLLTKADLAVDETIGEFLNSLRKRK